ncbi:MAG: YdcF family protein, partial [Alphaproteobacteria bacterium]|nr:YdcF family protein [Alphaproteobacteria bacterium]
MGGAALAFVAWAAGLLWFAAAMPEAVEDDDSPTDAIVVLTGGSERLSAGFHLLASQRARKLFVSGVYHGVEVAELLSLSRQTPDEVECCIVLGYSADNTVGNALETAEWMAREGFSSLRLVTAQYHMRRSLLEFDAA